MTTIATQHPRAVPAVEAIHTSDLPRWTRLLAEHSDLATARLGDDDPAGCRAHSSLHVATDWHGRFPNGAATVALLVEAGADVNARFRGPHAKRAAALGRGRSE